MVYAICADYRPEYFRELDHELGIRRATELKAKIFCFTGFYWFLKMKATHPPAAHWKSKVLTLD